MQYRNIIGMVGLMLLCVLWFSPDAMAQAAPAAGTGGDTCSSSPIFQNEYNPDEPGLVTQTVNYIREVVTASVLNLFLGISNSSEYRAAAIAAVTLTFIIYAVSFMFGIVPLTLGQALIRLFKVIFVFIMLSPFAWTYFGGTVYEFFDRGTDELIALFINVGIGNSTVANGTLTGGVFENGLFSTTNNPFRIFDGLVAQVTEPESITAFLAMLTTGPIGLAMGLLFGASSIIFLLAVLQAMQIYAVSLIAKGLLFGIAPIVFVMLLFERTKQIFTGWVNQLINFSLQPILMFAFLSFYIILLESAYNNMLNGVEICYDEVTFTEGSVSPGKAWRIRTLGADGTPRTWDWQGAQDCIGSPGSANCPDFPISVIDLLTFLLTAYLGWKMTSIVPSIAIEISGSSLLLNQVGAATSWGNSGGGGGSIFSSLRGGG